LPFAKFFKVLSFGALYISTISLSVVEPTGSTGDLKKPSVDLIGTSSENSDAKGQGTNNKRRTDTLQ